MANVIASIFKSYNRLNKVGLSPSAAVYVVFIPFATANLEGVYV